LNFLIFYIFAKSFFILGKPKVIPPAPLKAEIQLAFNSYCSKLNNGLFSEEDLAEWDALFLDQSVDSTDTYVPDQFPTLLSHTSSAMDSQTNSSFGASGSGSTSIGSFEERLVFNSSATGHHALEVDINDWIAVCPTQNVEEVVDPFWFGQVISMNSNHVVVAWYVPNLQDQSQSAWKKDKTTSKIHKGCILCKMPSASYTPPKALPIPFLFKICQALPEYTIFGL
jgi:hypothetical protein